MISTVVSHNHQTRPKDSNGHTIQTISKHPVWTRSTNQFPFGIEKNPIPNKKPRPKVGRQFFEHDTRQNNVAKLKRRKQSMLNLRRRYPEIPTNSDEHHTLPCVTEDTSSSGHDDTKSATSFANDCSPTHRPPTAPAYSPEEVNNQLRKKLFKIQRQLRLQTEALRQQNIIQCAPRPMATKHLTFPMAAAASGCCCSLNAYRGNEDLQRMNAALMQNKQFANYQQHVHQHNQATTMSTESAVSECNHHQTDVSISDTFHPFRVQGLRSVVR